MLDRRLVEQIARDLLTSPGLVEKDWHVTRAISVLAAFDHDGATPAFGGGTSLSKAWGLIKRFSEDIDFKVAMPPTVSRNKAKQERSAYRERILEALTGAGFVLAREPAKRDENRFFSAELFYAGLFDAGRGLRPHIRVEMSLMPAAMPAIPRSIGSLINTARRELPEVATFPCVNPIETAADKLSALAWRVQARRRGSASDDPTIIRHLHDLAALKPTVSASYDFPALARKAASEDTGRGGEAIAASDPAIRFTDMIERLSVDPLWAAEYQFYVDSVSFSPANERIGFEQALAALRELVALVGETPS